MQESCITAFNRLQDWEQEMTLSSLKRLVSMVNAKSIEAEPILAVDPGEN
jgi:hypothetical protein